MNFRDDPVALRAWLSRPCPTVLPIHATHCAWPAERCSCDAIQPAWRSFATECACAPVAVADGTFGFVMAVCDACQAAKVAI